MGRFALAATAKASATRKAMFCPCTPIPPTIDTAPMTSTVRRATLTSAFESTSPLRMTFE